MVTLIRTRLRIDDTPDVFAGHGVGGIFGTVMIAAFGKGSWIVPLGAFGIVGPFTCTVTAARVLLCRLATEVRVDPETEHPGLDLARHGESAWDHAS
ncbi:ammonium transporter, Amt family [Celeribacter indicus]|uniref:Ammonium transporter n=1 Tax=Celeribacter indicus TaxID=1208324 RepID=A0A0B5DVA8_9RHOB|nr:ammonium transporter [Celeribacter indicus]SDW77748.1 ammonium transporter, Amt family [Celeribacter indicus]